MRRIDARRKNASAFRLRFSQSLASLRQRLSQAMVRSTIQRLGNTTNPLTRSERLTISTSRCGRTFASALANFGRDLECRPDERWRGAGGLLLLNMAAAFCDNHGDLTL